MKKSMIQQQTAKLYMNAIVLANSIQQHGMQKRFATQCNQRSGKNSNQIVGTLI
jgi:hypothetical protein